MTLLNHANMDTLPLELKQRICSFLTPKELKPLRLTCKVFATAAERYFIHRFILFNHPDSVATLRKIIDHKIFNRYLMTLICDTSFVEEHPNYDDCREPVPENLPPSWDDYRPKTLVLDETESYGSLTKKVMIRAHDEYQNAWRAWETRKRDEKARRGWYQAFAHVQESRAHCLEVRTTLKKAFEKCPRLSNLVLSTRHLPVVQKSRFGRTGIEETDTRGMWCWRSQTLIKFWRYLSQLNSLTLISTGIEEFPANRPSITLPHLKHLRISVLEGETADFTRWRRILRGATSLETLSLALVEEDITKIVETLRSDCLRMCLLDFLCVKGDVLIDFLLHHASSLQRLGLGCGMTDIGWSRVFSSIAGRLPALERVQFEALVGGPDLDRMTPLSAQKAERFVTFGGSEPLLRFEDHEESYIYPGRGTYTAGPKQLELPPGLWQDYEEIANEDWDGYVRYKYAA